MGVINTEPHGTVDLAISIFCFLCNAAISQGSMKTKKKRLSKKVVGGLDEWSAASYGRKILLIFSNIRTISCL